MPGDSGITNEEIDRLEQRFERRQRIEKFGARAFAEMFFSPAIKAALRVDADQHGQEQWEARARARYTIAGAEILEAAALGLRQTAAAIKGSVRRAR